MVRGLNGGVLLALLLAIIGVVPNIVLAQGKASDSLAIESRMEPYRATGISAQQEGQIKQIAAEFENMARARLARYEDLKRELIDLSLQPDPDGKQVFSRQDEMNKIMSEVNNARVKMLLQIRSVLTSEQKQQLVKRLRERLNSADGASGPPDETPAAKNETAPPGKPQ